jgi:hypothetical protein
VHTDICFLGLIDNADAQLTLEDGNLPQTDPIPAARNAARQSEAGLSNGEGLGARSLNAP